MPGHSSQFSRLVNAALVPAQPGIIGLAGEAPLFRYDSLLATFVRASVATWDFATPGGRVLVRTPTGVLRQPVSINGRRAFGFEGVRENFIEDSNDHDAASWAFTGSASISANEAGDPSGGSQADAIVHTAATGDGVQHTPVGVPVSSNAFLSRFLKQKAAFTDDTIQLRFQDHLGATNNQSIESSLVWQRQLFDAGDTDTPDGGSMRFRHRNAFAEARDLHVFGSQLEIGFFGSSLIETASAAAIREADDLIMATTPVAFREGAWFVDLEMGHSSTEWVAANNIGYLYRVTAANYLRFQGDGKLRYEVDDILVTTPALAWSRGQRVRITIDHVAGTVTRTGFTTGDGTSTVATPGVWPDSTVHVGALTAVLSCFALMTEPYPVAA